MGDIIFDTCVLMSIMGIMGVVFGIAEKVFDYAYEKYPSFKTAIDRLVGDEESEVQ